MRSTPKVILDHTFSQGQVDVLSFSAYISSSYSPWQTERSEIEGWDVAGYLHPYLLLSRQYSYGCDSNSDYFLYDLERGQLLSADADELIVLNHFENNPIDLDGSPIFETPEDPRRTSCGRRFLTWGWDVVAERHVIDGRPVIEASDSAAYALEVVLNRVLDAERPINTVRFIDNVGQEIIATSEYGHLNVRKLDEHKQVHLSLPQFFGLFLR